MKKFFHNLSRKEIYEILAFIVVLSCVALWQTGQFSVSGIFLAALFTLLSLGFVVGTLFLIAWVVKRIALAFGVPLGNWGSNRSLKAFIGARRRKLGRLGGGRRPLARGRTQFLLGLALGELGTRETDIDALRESAAAFRDALPALRAAGKDSKWALTQSNLAVTLLHLSRRETGTKSLEEAEAALRAAADAWEKADNKADWANVQWHLCAVLTQRGRLEDGTARLAEAVAAGQAALAAEDNSDVPLADARLQINLAWALACLGERETGIERLEEAVAMARESLRVIVEDKDDLLDKDESIEWRVQQSGNLGKALRCLGERRNDTELLREAVEALRSTAPLTTEKNAYDWAVVQDELARALRLLGEREAEPKLLAESLSASDAALRILTRETFPFDWAVAATTRANTRALLGARQNDVATLRRAIDDLNAALAVFERVEAPVQNRQCRDDLDRATALLDDLRRTGQDGQAGPSRPPGPMKPRPA